MTTIEATMWDKERLEPMQGLKYTMRNVLPINELKVREWCDSYDPDVWGKDTRLGFGVETHQLPCANLCGFCGRRLETAIDLVNYPQGYFKNLKVSQLVATGGLLGDPFLIHPENLGILIKSYSERFPNTPCRINTAGNMFSTEKLATEAVRAVIDNAEGIIPSIAVSVNQFKEKQYLQIMHPLDRKGAFDRVRQFVHASIAQVGEERVLLSVVDYSRLGPEVISRRRWPIINREEMLSLAPSVFGVSSEQVVFRGYDETVK